MRPFGVFRPLAQYDNYRTEQVSATIAGKIIYFPAAAYADLYNLNKSSIQVTASPVASTVTIHGADGERGYEVIYIFDRFGLQKRIVETLFKKQTILFLVKEKDA